MNKMLLFGGSPPADKQSAKREPKGGEMEPKGSQMERKGSQMELKWSQKGAGMERGPSQELFFSLYVSRAWTPAAVTLLVKLLLIVARRQGTDTSSCNTASEAAT